ncbi:NADPH-dependent FMN reductase [Chthoniobacter flavus Ellin428]|uniref:NADPH-dependent FMN reductase n=1 Tax=Chthoniobacter flavus Ellin428 TaxID=497964 RepID=B4D0V5_9BACT|nr:NAD(P)H-dependent oxidoreductase [Chthoniobacter flavus]EDY19967.1 NADPH-dependent FMN reductase [Chthoniobacter flavus Ellin428]TCO91764.1 FMN reductase [Chthoniobacter flavus]
MSSCLVVSTALRAQSKTLTLARAMTAYLEASGVKSDLFDLASEPLPPCDGASCYADASVKAATERVKQAAGIVFCSPVYNYQLNSAAKNFLELTNDGWPDKIVGIVANAGGDRSFLSVLTLVNSLWVDHRCLVAPRFVYATGTAFAENGTLHETGEVRDRLQSLATDMHRLITRLALS